MPIHIQFHRPEFLKRGNSESEEKLFHKGKDAVASLNNNDEAKLQLETKKKQDRANRHRLFGGLITYSSGSASTSSLVKNATIHWPDGRTSKGTASEVNGQGYAFTLDEKDPVAKERKAYSSAKAIASIMVTQGKRSKNFYPKFPTLEEMGLTRNGKLFISGEKLELQKGKGLVSSGIQILSKDELTRVIEASSGGKGDEVYDGRGVYLHGRVAILNICAATLRAVAEQFLNKNVVINVAKALESPVFLDFSLARRREEDGRDELESSSTLGKNALISKISTLEDGEHIYLPLATRTRLGGHLMGLSISKNCDSSEFRVSFTNTENEIPGRYVDVSFDHLEKAIPSLLDASFIYKDKDFGHSLANAIQSDLSFRRWLKGIDNTHRVSSAYFGGTDLKQPIQNGGSCAVENTFAFLATVLSPADYKRAKAACLNTVMQIVETAKKEDGFDAIELSKRGDRLSTRITTALSGSAVSTGSAG